MRGSQHPSVPGRIRGESVYGPVDVWSPGRLDTRCARETLSGVSAMHGGQGIPSRWRLRNSQSSRVSPVRGSEGFGSISGGCGWEGSEEEADAPTLRVSLVAYGWCLG